MLTVLRKNGLGKKIQGAVTNVLIVLAGMVMF